MQLQPIVGSACAHCQQRILVDVDGKNCPRCGLAIHRRCSKGHRTECIQRPALPSVRHDYDEVPPLQWTTRLVVTLATGAFLLAMGLGALVGGPSEPSNGDGSVTRSALGQILGWGGLVAGLVVTAGGYYWERARQSARATS